MDEKEKQYLDELIQNKEKEHELKIKSLEKHKQAAKRKAMMERAIAVALATAALTGAALIYSKSETHKKNKFISDSKGYFKEYISDCSEFKSTVDNGTITLGKRIDLEKLEEKLKNSADDENFDENKFFVGACQTIGFNASNELADVAGYDVEIQNYSFDKFVADSIEEAEKEKAENQGRGIN